MLIELYFGRPTLTRAFFHEDRTDYLLLHTHDLDLDVVRSRVIYLYRDPVDTVYSQMRYHDERTDGACRIAYWSDLYGQHVHKWLYQETFTEKKTVVRYDRLEANLLDEFGKVCAHFDVAVEPEHLRAVAAQVSKRVVKTKTGHDPRVITLSENYVAERQRFRTASGDLVWAAFLRDRECLRSAFA
jgi:hypothetical protein